MDQVVCRMLEVLALTGGIGREEHPYGRVGEDRKSTRLNSSHRCISYAVFCLKKKSRILVIDTAVAQRCAALHVPSPRSDRDALIATTALVHVMTLVHRNVDHFQPTGVAVINH